MWRIWMVGATLIGLTAGSVHAGVEVVPGAARRGEFGLRAEVREACQNEEIVLVLGPVAGEQRVEACREIVVGAEVQTGGTLTAVAGERVTFTDGFHVERGGRLAVGTDGSWDPGFVVDESPSREGRLFIRWYTRFGASGLAPGEKLTFLRARGEREERASIRYEATSGGGWIWAEVAEEDGARRSSPRAAVGSGWHRLELEWDSGDAIAASGRVRLLLDGALVGSIENLALATVLLDAIELGVMEAEAPGGWVDFDDFASARGALLGAAE